MVVSFSPSTPHVWGVTDKAVEYALFTRPADLGHAFLPFTYADGKLLCQPAVACSFIRFTDDVGCGLLAPCQRYVFTPLSFSTVSALPVPLRFPLSESRTCTLWRIAPSSREIVSFRLSFSA